MNQDLKPRLATAYDRLLEAIRGVTEEQFKRRPPASESDPSPWCIAEVLAHLLATNRVWLARLEQALRSDGSPVTPTDPAQHEAMARAGRLAPVPQLIHGLLADRRAFGRIVEAAEAGTAFDNAVEHPVRGHLTVLWMLEEYGVKHAEEHAAQIDVLRETVGAKPAGQT